MHTFIFTSLSLIHEQVLPLSTMDVGLSIFLIYHGCITSVSLICNARMPSCLYLNYLNYSTCLLTTGDSKRTWQTIHELTSRKYRKTVVTSLKVNEASITNQTQISNEFNDHFTTVGPKLAHNNY